MATIVLDYNARNVQARKAIEYILSLGLFKPQKHIIEKKETLSERTEHIDKIFEKYLIDLSDFKFNRDDANNYD